jgi:ribonuclease P protein component
MPEGVMAGSAQVQTGGKPLPGPFRLEASKYKSVFAEKQSFYGQTLTIWVARLPDAGRRAGVIVSKKTFHRAVDRNRAKRLMREAFRLSRYRIDPQIALILIARSGIAGKKCQDVMRDFERACCRARIWRREDPEVGEHA